MKTLKKIIIILVYSFTYIHSINIAYSQKLPGVQKDGMLIPNNCKIDGKSTEWNDNFQAYNRATQLYYTIANDSKNIYLVFKARNGSIADKIMQGGITLTLADYGQKDRNSGSSITYPVIRPADRRLVDQEIFAAKNNTDGTSTDSVEKKLSADNFMNRQDSITASINRRLVFMVNEIKTTRLNGVADSTLSIYNEYGIKALLSFDNKNNLICEFEIPLERLNTNKINKLYYHVTLNGIHNPGIHITLPPGSLEGHESGETINVFRGVGQVTPQNMTPRMAEMIAERSPTDFSGKYKLVN